MAAPSTRSTNPAIREVARGLAGAADAQILRVVAMVDAMPDRGAADQLIAPLRARLARLRPPRPLRFARLLFLPLDPLIVPAARWRPEQPAIPRTVIPLLTAAVMAALGPLGQSVAATIEGRSTQDLAVIEQAGSVLWKNAAGLLMEADRPDGWEATGLSARAHKPLSRRIGALLSEAARLRHMMTDAGQGLVPPEADLLAMFEAAIGLEPEVQPMLIALLLAHVPDAAPILPRVATVLGQRGGALMRHAGEQATDILLDQLEAPGGAEGQLGGEDLAEAGAAVRRLTSLLHALDGEALTRDRRERLNSVRQRVRSGCEALFTERLAADLIEPLRACAGGHGAGAMGDLESAARGLRMLEAEARRAGDDKTYDALLEHAAEVVREMIGRGGLDRAGGMRLMEIVAGPDAALALLEAAV